MGDGRRGRDVDEVIERIWIQVSGVLEWTRESRLRGG